ncbi:MAG: hypothetical protein E7645_04725 [Ruminococcaceae bacterium]|nr:hypothetical protein [Oscillospiraceae bacterium]
MKKVWIVGALCALTVLTAAACGGETPPPVTTDAPTEKMTAEVTNPVDIPTEALTEILTEMPTETLTEAVTQDPMELCKPAYLIDPETLVKHANTPSNTNYNQQIAEAYVTDHYATLVCSGGDPYVAAIKPGTREATTTKLVAIKYRTVDDHQGELFIGSSGTWTGNGDHVAYSYIPDGEWHLLLVDLNGVTALTPRGARYMRFDFFADGSAGRSIDVQYIAFFETPEQAEMYDDLVSPKVKNENTFMSDVTTQTDGTSFENSDLGTYFESIDVENATNRVKDGMYVLEGTGGFMKPVKGSYALVADMKQADGDAYAVVRYTGQTGVWAKVSGGQFELLLDTVNGAHRYTLPAEGTILTVADSGDKLYFMVDDQLMATVALLGKGVYGSTSAALCASTAYVRLADGSAGKLTETLISAERDSDMGFVIREGVLTLASIKVIDFDAVSLGSFGQTMINIKDDLASSDYWTADVEQIGCVPHPDSQCTTKQGGWTDGTYYYQLFIKKDTASDEKNNIVKLVKYDLTTGEVVKTSEDLGLNHANDLTYNPKRNIFVAVHNNPNRKKVSIIDPDTFEVVDTVTLGCKIFSLDYNEVRDQYIIGVAGGQTFRFLDADFQFVSETVYQPTSLSKGYTTQGVTCDDKYIYFVLYNQNCLTVYDWDGNFITYVQLNISGEPENLSIVGNDIYISSAHGDGAHIFKIVNWQKTLPVTEAKQ